MSLENAPPEIKLAVDLIMLLEENQIEPHIALAALEIVRTDLEKKLSPKDGDADLIIKGKSPR
ncbi:pleiotropic regulatory protein RsmS [Pectobacterium aroidearum]|uniref:pleiotropic regulatory protein RsmS n=1 Tax=Pectobacterium aroidearum TaxID=1201031 RepID=UPI002A826B35|nr:pleiotropic regulatory protein RsmS [Pectobacterium aroidearum]MDY4387607.1 pleiotropic regulatory protein RsmS [Pectobacterium aroidearum]